MEGSPRQLALAAGLTRYDCGKPCSGCGGTVRTVKGCDCPRCRSRHPSKARHKRRQQLRQKYGIEVQDWQAMFERQGERCAICRVEKVDGRQRHWCTDHDHNTGRVRGVLCSNCNRGLGLFADNPAVLVAAAAYVMEG